MMGNSFDDKAATWDENPGRIALVEKVWEVIKKQIPLGTIQKVLDYGCGTGLLGYKTINNVDLVTFCDTSKGMLEQVERKKEYYNYNNVEILQSDFTSDKIPQKKYDLILSMLVLHHVENIPLLLEKFKEILTKGGLFCWIDLDQEDGSFHTDSTDIPHLGFSKSEIESYFDAAGFQSTFYSTELFLQRERENGLRNYPLFIVIAEK